MKQFHIMCENGELGKYVILTGDPGRVEKIADHLENPSFVAQNREFVSYNGFLAGEKVTVLSTGIGGPSAAIAVEEAAGVRGTEEGIVELGQLGLAVGTAAEACFHDAEGLWLSSAKIDIRQQISK